MNEPESRPLARKIFLASLSPHFYIGNVKIHSPLYQGVGVLSPVSTHVSASLLIFLSLLLLRLPAYGKQQVNSPKREVRGVWITTILGLDWPKSTDVLEQQHSLREMVAKLKSSNVNTIFFQVRGRADAMYRSEIEPWSSQLTGNLGEDPGWDPLAFIIAETHERGMELHAWFNTFLVKTTKERPPSSVPLHIVHAHPEWVSLVDNEWWLDPGIPEVREYLSRVALDIVRKYDVDGIQFDFARYPQKPLSDDATYRKYGGDVPKEEWRRENVTQFLSSASTAIRALKPMLKIGAAPIGIYKNSPGIRGLQSYSELYQDSRFWLRTGIVDYLAPQLYWSMGEKPANPDFEAVAEEWSVNSFGRHLYPGIGAFKNEVREQLPVIIDVVRSDKFPGHAFFRYENIYAELPFDGRYAFPANIPPMPWKDSLPPLPPSKLHVENIVDGIFDLSWRAPDRAADGDDARYFNIYRSTRRPVDVNDVRNLVRTTTGSQARFLDTISHPSAARYYYAVSAFDKGNNESEAVEESVIIPEILQMAERFRPSTRLVGIHIDSDADLIFVSYEVRSPAPVIIKILDERNRELQTVVDEVREPGAYIAAVDSRSLRKGSYASLMIAGNVNTRKSFFLER